MAIAPQQYDWNHPPEYFAADVSIRQKTGSTGLLKLYANFNNSFMSLNRADLNNGNKLLAYDLNNDNFYLNGSWQTTLGKNWIYRSGISLTENNDIIDFDQKNFRETLRGFHQKNLFIHQLNQKVIVRMGTDFFGKTFMNDYTEDDTKISADYSEFAGAAFAEAEIYLSNKFVMRAGGRAEYSDYLRHFNLSPRFSAAYKLNDHSMASLAYGRFTQNPLNSYLIYSDKLQPERAEHYILTFQSSKKGRLLRSEIYYKNYDDLVKVKPDDFHLPQAYDNSGEGYAYGLDVFWRDRKTFKNAEYWISYGYISAERDFRDYPQAAIPSFVSKHNLSVVFKHWINPIRSLAGVSYKFSSPRVYHDPNLPGFHNRKTIPFHSLDVNLSYLHRENIIFYLGITNLPGFKQEYGNRFADTPGEDGIYASEPVVPGADRFFVVACFITLSKRGDLNQMDKIQ
jgi:outer membrane receptor for ferrienterochelin and colicin